MIEIEKPQIECIEDSANSSYGKYVVEPLERGYGITLGNALRRIMLSSLPGTAATAIKIAGVQHEFSTIPGVKEDVTEIVLNIKSLLTKLHGDSGKTVYIEAVGPCTVTAGDIKADGEVEILNPDLHIATLDSGATLNMEITLSHGRGYVPADRNKPTQNVIGTIAVALSVVLSVTVLALYLLFYHQIFAVTFDESFSRATGLKVDACNTLLAILTALTIVLGMRMMGAMLISSLVIFPALTAMRLFKSFRGVILCAAVTSVVCFCVGLTISFGFSTPVGATVVAADLTVFLAACLLAALRRK